MYADNKRLTVINFFAGPGVGKSTTAAGLFNQMKKRNFKIELVHEVAKDYVWESWKQIFGEQDFIFANQHRLIRRLVRHDIDYAIVDSSILLTIYYMPEWYPDSFRKFGLDVFNTYDNINILLQRNPTLPYIHEGRNETHEEALRKDKGIEKFLRENNISCHEIMAGDEAVGACLSVVQQHTKLECTTPVDFHL